MHVVTRLIALTRAVQLRRQFREINRSLEHLAPNLRRQLAAIALREFANASKSEFPHLYGTVDQGQRYQPWGNGTDIGFARMKADNQHLQLRGIALWLTVAYYETKESAYGDMQQLHRHLMRTLRLLKESMPANPADSLWTTQPNGKAAAA